MRSYALLAVAFAASALAGPVVSTVTTTTFTTTTALQSSGKSSSSSASTITSQSQIKASTKKTATKRKTSTKKTAHKTTKGPPGPTASTYVEAVINHHNYHRANHSADPLTWSPKMASFARGIAKSCNYAHNIAFGGGGYGQNIAAGAAASDISGVITDLFYDGEVNYYKGLYGKNNPNMENFESWGHFSQVVWKDTRQVGCYTMDCSKHKGGLKGITGVYDNISPLFTVCNYSPPGNYEGEYLNVGRPLNHPTVRGTYKVNEKNIKNPNPPPASFYQ